MHLKNCVVVSSIKLNLNATKMGMHMILNDLSHKWDQNTPYNAVPNAQIIFRKRFEILQYFFALNIFLRYMGAYSKTNIIIIEYWIIIDFQTLSTLLIRHDFRYYPNFFIHYHGYIYPKPITIWIVFFINLEILINKWLKTSQFYQVKCQLLSFNLLRTE